MGKVRPNAIIRIPWAKEILLEFNYELYPEALQEEWRSWSWNGTTIIDGDQAYPADLIQHGLISFDGQKVVVNERLPSMVRTKTPIGAQRKGRIGNLFFPECQDFLLKTDFGPRRTIECKGIGLIARDEYSRINHTFYPQQRLVTTHVVKWIYPKFGDITKIPPYHDELATMLRELSNGLDLYSSCKVDFDDLLEGE